MRAKKIEYATTHPNINEIFNALISGFITGNGVESRLGLYCTVTVDQSGIYHLVDNRKHEDLLSTPDFLEIVVRIAQRWY